MLNWRIVDDKYIGFFNETSAVYIIIDLTYRNYKASLYDSQRVDGFIGRLFFDYLFEQNNIVHILKKQANEYILERRKQRIDILLN